jgi:hypothetical protein
LEIFLLTENENLNFTSFCFIYQSVYEIKEYQMDEACRTHGGDEEMGTTFWSEGLREKPLGRNGCRWDDNVKVGLKKTGCEGVDWIHMAQDRDQWRALVNTEMNLRFPQKAGNLTFSRNTLR